MFAWMFRGMYRRRLKKRHTQLVKDFEENGGEEEAFVILNNYLLKYI